MNDTLQDDIEAIARAQVALRRAAMDPNAAISAGPLAARAPTELPAEAGVAAPQQVVQAITFAVEVAPIPQNRRWRYFLFYCLLKLACRIVDFRFEIYRTQQPWD